MTREKTKTVLEITMVYGFLLTVLVIFAEGIFADQMPHKFKSPSFSGNGTSSHYLTIENQEHTRKMTIKEELQALQDEIERDAENTTLPDAATPHISKLANLKYLNLYGTGISDASIENLRKLMNRLM